MYFKRKWKKLCYTNSLSTITTGHIDACHFISTIPFQCIINQQLIFNLSINKHFIMSIHAIMNMFLYYKIMHLLGLFNTAGSPWTCMFVLLKVWCAQSYQNALYYNHLWLLHWNKTLTGDSELYHIKEEFLVECILFKRKCKKLCYTNWILILS